MNINNEVARLRVLKSFYDNQRYKLEDNFTYKYPRLINEERRRLECIIKNIEKRNMNSTEKFSININVSLKYKVDLGDSPQGDMTRIEKIVKNLEDRMTKSEETIENHKKNLENSKLEYEKSFPYEEEYKAKLAR